jgi:hypothetical protein
MSRSRDAASQVEHALEFLDRARNTDGVWGARAGGDGDIVATYWAWQCFAAARNGGLWTGVVLRPDELESRIAQWLDRRLNKKTGTVPMDEYLWSTTEQEVGVAIAILLELGIQQALESKQYESVIAVQVKHLDQNRPDARTVDYHYWWYGSAALAQSGERGVRAWREWKKKLGPILVDRQEPNGAWRPEAGAAGPAADKELISAVAVLTLETPFALPSFR